MAPPRKASDNDSNDSDEGGGFNWGLVYDTLRNPDTYKILAVVAVVLHLVPQIGLFLSAGQNVPETCENASLKLWLTIYGIILACLLAMSVVIGAWLAGQEDPKTELRETVAVPLTFVGSIWLCYTVWGWFEYGMTPESCEAGGGKNLLLIPCIEGGVCLVAFIFFIYRRWKYADALMAKRPPVTVSGWLERIANSKNEVQPIKIAADNKDKVKAVRAEKPKEVNFATEDKVRCTYNKMSTMSGLCQGDMVSFPLPGQLWMPGWPIVTPGLHGKDESRPKTPEGNPTRLV